MPWAVGSGAGLARGEDLTASRLVPRGRARRPPAGRVALHVVSADPAAVDLLAPGLSARVYPVAGGPALAVAARCSRPTRPASGGPAGLTDPPPRGVVLSLSAAEADAVLAGHGSLDGPVTVTVVASAGLTGGHGRSRRRLSRLSDPARHGAAHGSATGPRLLAGTDLTHTRHRPTEQEPP